MATAGELVAQDALIDLSTALEDHQVPQRCMYAFPSFQEWYDDVLPNLLCDIRGDGRVDPLGQVDDLLVRFLTGAPFDVEWKSKGLRPYEKAVWELKTPDVRLFGWFWRPNNFILHRAAEASWVKDNNLYYGHIEETVFQRDKLNLDPPKFIRGGYDDVFCL